MRQLVAVAFEFQNMSSIIITSAAAVDVDMILAQKERIQLGHLIKQLLKAMAKHNISYEMFLHPSVMLVHDKNRGGLGLNWNEVHGNGKKIIKIGADLDLLQQSVCFELPTEPKKRDIKIEFNKQLVKSSCEMLAPLSGKERFCSVSTGHTVAFCRATSGRCITPEDDLKDDDGRLDPVALTEKDESFREMVQKGWTWTVIPSFVEDRWPEIPELFQQSFNAKNNVAAKSTELEAACLMATHARLQRERNPGAADIDWDACIKMAAAVSYTHLTLPTNREV